jgi:hypothetical protein
MVDLPVSVAILLGTYVLCISLNSNRERESLACDALNQRQNIGCKNTPKTPIYVLGP